MSPRPSRQGRARVAGNTVTLYKADDLTDAAKGPWAELAAADVIVFGAPTYMGSASAVFKQFMDASSKAWYGDVWKNKLAAGFTNSASWSGDKLNTLQQMSRVRGTTRHDLDFDRHEGRLQFIEGLG